MKKLLVVTLFTLFCSAAHAAEPQRSQGISVYLNPERIVAQTNKEHIQRFLVSGTDGKSVLAYDTTASGLIEQIKQQPKELRENGIWLVYTNPDSYTETDKNEQAQLGVLSKENNIPFFECRASELPDGWKRIH